MNTRLGDAVALHQQGRLAEADAAYRAVLSSDPKLPDAWFLLGIVALQSGRPVDADELIQTAIVAAPDRAQYHFNLGSALGQAGRPADAVTAYDRALDRQADYPEAARGKATALIALGRLPPSLRLVYYTNELNDFGDTAALVGALDLVISVDTAMVHLAGGPGVPVWVLNRFDTC